MSWVLDARVWASATAGAGRSSDCDLQIPAGHVVGLVGPNGAGKTTLLQLAVGLLSPTAGTIEVLGRPPAADPAQLARWASWPRTRRPTPGSAWRTTSTSARR